MTPNQLPPLPEPDRTMHQYGKQIDHFTADQMHAYALAALAQQAQEPVASERVSFLALVDQLKWIAADAELPTVSEHTLRSKPILLLHRGRKNGDRPNVYTHHVDVAYLDSPGGTTKPTPQLLGYTTWKFPLDFGAKLSGWNVVAWAEIPNGRTVDFGDREFAEVYSQIATPAPQVPAKCLTCSGHGEIGGHMPDGSGHGEPCPACNAPQPAPVDELPDLNPEDVVVDVVLKQLGGFAPVTTHGVRVTHKPSCISVVVDSERSQHRNRQLALEALRAIIHHQAHPVPAPVDDLIEALEGLMDWQVKNVAVWHNRAYDRAHRAIKKHRAALQSPAPQTKGQP